MHHLKYVSIKRWCEGLRNDTLLQYLIGSFDPPSSSSHYDFIIRLTGCDPHLSDLYDKDHHEKTDKKMLKKGEKLVNFTSEDTFSLCEKDKNGADCDRQRMMFNLQSLLRRLQGMTLFPALHQQLSFLISILISVPNTSVTIPQLTAQPFTCISVATISHRLSIVINEEIPVKNTMRRNISTKMAYRYALQVIL